MKELYLSKNPNRFGKKGGDTLVGKSGFEDKSAMRSLCVGQHGQHIGSNMFNYWKHISNSVKDCGSKKLWKGFSNNIVFKTLDM